MGVEVRSETINQTEKVIFVKGLPPFSQLEKEVTKIVKSSSWMERHGWDAVIHMVGFSFFLASLLLMASTKLSSVLLGAYIYGACFWMLSSKAGHMALHGAVCESKSWNKFWSWFFLEFIGTFCSDVGFDVHIRQHHPYTNIIGLGDSSIWRLTFLPRQAYLFLAPLLLPIATPFVALGSLWGLWLRMLMFIVSVAVGFGLMAWPLVSLGGYSYTAALAMIVFARSLHAINYLHLNIFQHIGLPMYKQASRPTRLFQMTSGVMSIDRHPLLDWTFGHSLVSCHVEHHLFPRLSDNMCLKVKPLVRNYLTSLGLPYNQRPYLERLRHFYDNYEELIVQAPPITHFVGIQ